MTVFEHKDCLFGEGADSRIAGLPFKDCPYDNPVDALYWKAGWRSADSEWGVDVKGRWVYRRLPEVVK